MASRDIEVTLPDQTFVLNFGTNAACRLEKMLKDDGRSWGDVIYILNTQPRPPVVLIRQFVKAAMVAPADASLDDVGTFIDNVGGWARVLHWFKTDEQGHEPTLDAPADAVAEPQPVEA